MDNTARIEALKLAKGLITSHGIMFHMNKYNRELAAREIRDDTVGLRYDFQLDPSRDSWSSSNPSCSLQVSYSAEHKGSRLAPDGAMVLDHHRRINVTAAGSEMDLALCRRREGMVNLLMMLCDMLEASLPQLVTTTMETAEEVVDRKQRASEQLMACNIVSSLGAGTLKGLRRGGTPRHRHLSSEYLSAYGSWPEAGSYRYRHIKSTNSRGVPKEIHFYMVRVYGTGSEAPTVSIRRLKEAP